MNEAPVGKREGYFERRQQQVKDWLIAALKEYQTEHPSHRLDLLVVESYFGSLASQIRIDLIVGVITGILGILMLIVVSPAVLGYFAMRGDLNPAERLLVAICSFEQITFFIAVLPAAGIFGVARGIYALLFRVIPSLLWHRSRIGIARVLAMLALLWLISNDGGWLFLVPLTIISGKEGDLLLPVIRTKVLRTLKEGLNPRTWRIVGLFVWLKKSIAKLFSR